MGSTCYVVGAFGDTPIVTHSFADARMAARAIVDNKVRKHLFDDAEGYDHAVESIICPAIEIVGSIAWEA